ncbi:unnamed protein product (mitochondrion) [Plasmodiophora brassicae]|uniref:EF-hand domain-containing protein n=1 Tax=Plasmodiophora brassicae TaxID=37360 RepID=A0A3P3Y5M8_PLABS|nr:unnamed protein product [Plasmodiophora brassicae]
MVDAKAGTVCTADWSSETVRGQFLDVFVDESDANDFATCFRDISSVLQVILGNRQWTARFGPADLLALSTFAKAFEESAQVCTKLSSLRTVPVNFANFSDVLGELQDRLGRLDVNSCLAFEGGLLSADGTRTPMVYIFFRRESTFTLAICNTTFGAAKYHPSRGENGGKTRVMQTILVDEIPLATICQESAGLFALLRMFIVRCKENTLDMLYEVIVPYLCGRPVKHLRARQPLRHFRTPQRSNTAYRSVREALLAGLILHGFNAQHVKYLTFLIRLAVLQSITGPAPSSVASLVAQEMASCASKRVAASLLTDQMIADVAALLREIMPAKATSVPSIKFPERETVRWMPLPSCDALAARFQMEDRYLAKERPSIPPPKPVICSYAELHDCAFVGSDTTSNRLTRLVPIARRIVQSSDRLHLMMLTDIVEQFTLRLELPFTIEIPSTMLSTADALFDLAEVYLSASLAQQSTDEQLQRMTITLAMLAAAFDSVLVSIPGEDVPPVTSALSQFVFGLGNGTGESLERLTRESAFPLEPAFSRARTRILTYFSNVPPTRQSFQVHPPDGILDDGHISLVQFLKKAMEAGHLAKGRFVRLSFDEVVQNLPTMSSLVPRLHQYLAMAAFIAIVLDNSRARVGPGYYAIGQGLFLPDLTIQRDATGVPRMQIAMLNRTRLRFVSSKPRAFLPESELRMHLSAQESYSLYRILLQAEGSLRINLLMDFVRNGRWHLMHDAAWFQQLFRHTLFRCGLPGEKPVIAEVPSPTSPFNNNALETHPHPGTIVEFVLDAILVQTNSCEGSLTDSLRFIIELAIAMLSHGVDDTKQRLKAFLADDVIRRCVGWRNEALSMRDPERLVEVFSLEIRLGELLTDRGAPSVDALVSLAAPIAFIKAWSLLCSTKTASHILACRRGIQVRNSVSQTLQEHPEWSNAVLDGIFDVVSLSQAPLVSGPWVADKSVYTRGSVAFDIQSLSFTFSGNDQHIGRVVPLPDSIKLNPDVARQIPSQARFGTCVREGLWRIADCDLEVHLSPAFNDTLLGELFRRPLSSCTEDERWIADVLGGMQHASMFLRTTPIPLPTLARAWVLDTSANVMLLVHRGAGIVRTFDMSPPACIIVRAQKDVYVSRNTMLSFADIPRMLVADAESMWRPMNSLSVDVAPGIRLALRKVIPDPESEEVTTGKKPGAKASAKAPAPTPKPAPGKSTSTDPPPSDADPALQEQMRWVDQVKAEGILVGWSAIITKAASETTALRLCGTCSDSTAEDAVNILVDSNDGSSPFTRALLWTQAMDTDPEPGTPVRLSSIGTPSGVCAAIEPDRTISVLVDGSTYTVEQPEGFPAALDITQSLPRHIVVRHRSTLELGILFIRKGLVVPLHQSRVMLDYHKMTIEQLLWMSLFMARVHRFADASSLVDAVGYEIGDSLSDHVREVVLEWLSDVSPHPAARSLRLAILARFPNVMPPDTGSKLRRDFEAYMFRVTSLPEGLRLTGSDLASLSKVLHLTDGLAQIDLTVGGAHDNWDAVRKTVLSSPRSMHARRWGLQLDDGICFGHAQRLTVEDSLFFTSFFSRILLHKRVGLLQTTFPMGAPYWPAEYLGPFCALHCLLTMPDDLEDESAPESAQGSAGRQRRFAHVVLNDQHRTLRDFITAIRFPSLPRDGQGRFVTSSSSSWIPWTRFADTLMDICDMLRERRVEGDADVVVDEPSLFNDSPEELASIPLPVVGSGQRWICADIGSPARTLLAYNSTKDELELPGSANSLTLGDNLYQLLALNWVLKQPDVQPTAATSYVHVLEDIRGVAPATEAGRHAIESLLAEVEQSQTVKPDPLPWRVVQPEGATDRTQLYDRLDKELQAQSARDLSCSHACLRKALSSANRIAPGRLDRTMIEITRGSVIPFDISSLLACWLSSTCIDSIRARNVDAGNGIIEALTAFLVYSTRAAHIESTRAALLAFRNDPQFEQRLSSLLCLRRGSLPPRSTLVDPRVLAFEFFTGLRLRPSQAAVYDQLSAASGSIQAVIAPGSGKSSVIVPLLALSSVATSPASSAVVLVSEQEFHSRREYLTKLFRFCPAMRSARFTAQDQGLTETDLPVYDDSRRPCVLLTVPSSVLVANCDLQLSLVQSCGASGRARLANAFQRSLCIVDNSETCLGRSLRYMHGFRTFPEGGSDRWTVALHIFDGLSADSAPSATRYIQQLNVDIVPAAVAAFNTLHGCVLRLRQDGHSKVPRVDDRVIYENNLLPALIEWVLVWAMAAGICSVTETDVRVIAKPSKIRAYFRADVARALCMQRRAKWDSRAAAALVHARLWLRVTLPHLLTLRYGKDYTRGPHQLLARAMDGSQFRSVDVAIGCTIMTFYEQGLRECDTHALICQMQNDWFHEGSAGRCNRPSDALFEQWTGKSTRSLRSVCLDNNDQIARLHQMISTNLSAIRHFLARQLLPKMIRWPSQELRAHITDLFPRICAIASKPNLVPRRPFRSALPQLAYLCDGHDAKTFSDNLRQWLRNLELQEACEARSNMSHWERVPLLRHLMEKLLSHHDISDSAQLLICGIDERGESRMTMRANMMGDAETSLSRVRAFLSAEQWNDAQADLEALRRLSDDRSGDTPHDGAFRSVFDADYEKERLSLTWTNPTEDSDLVELPLPNKSILLDMFSAQMDNNVPRTVPASDSAWPVMCLQKRLEKITTRLHVAKAKLPLLVTKNHGNDADIDVILEIAGERAPSAADSPDDISTKSFPIDVRKRLLLLFTEQMQKEVRRIPDILSSCAIPFHLEESRSDLEYCGIIEEAPRQSTKPTLRSQVLHRDEAPARNEVVFSRLSDADLEKPISATSFSRLLDGLVGRPRVDTHTFVVLTLREASSLFDAIAQDDHPVWITGRWSACLRSVESGAILIKSKRFVPAPFSTTNTALVCARFADARVEASHHDVHILQHILRSSTESQRRQFFVECSGRGNRVRDLCSWGATPLNRLFHFDDASFFTHARANFSKLRAALTLRYGDNVINCFKYIDRNGDGKLSYEELHQSLNELGLGFAPEDLYSLVAGSDMNSDGMIDFQEFTVQVFDGHVSSNGAVQDANLAVALEKRAADDAKLSTEWNEKMHQEEMRREAAYYELMGEEERKLKLGQLVGSLRQNCSTAINAAKTLMDCERQARPFEALSTKGKQAPVLKSLEAVQQRRNVAAGELSESRNNIAEIKKEISKLDPLFQKGGSLVEKWFVDSEDALGED